MRVLVSGSRNWVDYNEIMRKMTVVLDEWVSTNPEDKKITFVHSASTPAENMVTEYIGKVERLLKQKGYKITEQLIRPTERSRTVNELNELAVDRVVVFVRDSCKKSESLANITSAMGIQTDIVKG